MLYPVAEVERSDAMKETPRINVRRWGKRDGSPYIYELITAGFNVGIFWPRDWATRPGWKTQRGALAAAKATAAQLGNLPVYLDGEKV